MRARILLAEDEELVGTMVRMNLENAGSEVVWEKDGEAAWATAQRRVFDLLLLDINLPGLSGLELLTRIREVGVTTPVMMLTARNDVSTKVRALELGADDYLPKPFDVGEMMARAKALVRRSQAFREVPASGIVRFGRYEVNFESHEALTNTGRITLSDKEIAVLEALLRADGGVLTRTAIVEQAWGGETLPSERSVDGIVHRLRVCFEPDAQNPRHFVTVRGAGYRFVS